MGHVLLTGSSLTERCPSGTSPSVFRPTLLLLCAGALLVIVSSVTCSTSPTEPSPAASSARYQGTVLSAGGTVTIDVSLFTQQLSSRETTPWWRVVTPLLAQGPIPVTGEYELGDGRRGGISGTVSGSLSRGVFSGTLTNASNGCVAERRYSGEVSDSGLDWAAGVSLGSCPDDPLDFEVLRVPRSSASPTAAASTDSTSPSATTLRTTTSTTTPYPASTPGD